MKFSPEQKAHVARYAMESGNMRAIVRCLKQWGVDLKESKDVDGEVQGRTANEEDD